MTTIHSAYRPVPVTVIENDAEHWRSCPTCNALPVPPHTITIGDNRYRFSHESGATVTAYAGPDDSLYTLERRDDSRATLEVFDMTTGENWADASMDVTQPMSDIELLLSLVGSMNLR